MTSGLAKLLCDVAMHRCLQRRAKNLHWVGLLVLLGACAKPVEPQHERLSPDETGVGLRGFTCTTEFGAGKSPQGPMTVAFRTQGATGGLVHFEFHCTGNCVPTEECNQYVSEWEAEKCSRSAETAYAIDCGSSLRSTLVATVRAAEGVERVLLLEMPPQFSINAPAAADKKLCMPFIDYGGASKWVKGGALRFNLSACRLVKE